MKKVYFITIIAILLTAHSYGQKNDYLTILKSLPSVPDNVVLASKKEKQMYLDKLSDVHPMLLDYKRKFENIEEKEYTLSEYNSLENVLKEYESIYDKHIDKIVENFLGKLPDILQNNLILKVGLVKVNEPYLQQINELFNKPYNAENDKLIRNLRRKIYDSKLLLYPVLQSEMSDLLKQTFEEMSSATQYINKLDSLSVNVIKIPTAGAGSILLDNYVKQLEDLYYFYNLGSFEEYLKDPDAQTSDYSYVVPK